MGNEISGHAQWKLFLSDYQCGVSILLPISLVNAQLRPMGKNLRVSAQCPSILGPQVCLDL